jgi:DNA repair and recombination RAD54-like protein
MNRPFFRILTSNLPQKPDPNAPNARSLPPHDGQTVASLYLLLTKGLDGRPTCRTPLILCPSSLVANWGVEFARWLGDRVSAVTVIDTGPKGVRDALNRYRGCAGRLRVLIMSYNTFRLNAKARRRR